ncbi:MAG TPA: toll/interleukin-1 receptor domain-containing protein [Dehalococcoidia bacterium]
MKVFISYYSVDESDAEDIRDHLNAVFGKAGLETFFAASWESLSPGEAWETKLIEGVGACDGLLVLMSPDALTRPWVHFEVGVAWATKSRIIFLCHKGLTPGGLPRPYGSLTAVDLNGLKHQDKLNRIASAISTALGVSVPEGVEAVKEVADSVEEADDLPFATVHRTWSLRPGAHIGEQANGRFLIGAVAPARPERAAAAGLEPGEALYVRLFLGTSPEGRYLNAMAVGDTADFFERVRRDTTVVDARVRLAASALDDNGNPLPLMVIEEASNPIVVSDS